MPDNHGDGGAHRALRWALIAAGLLTASAAEAGGYDTGERDWDFVFQQDTVGFEAGTIYVNPQRTLSTVTPTGAFLPSATDSDVREAAPFAISRVSLATRLGDNVRCMASYRQPFAGYADYGSTWVGAASAITQDFSSMDLGLTCVLSAPVGPGDLSFLGGVSYQEINYELTQAAGIAGILTTSVSDASPGWRAGVAYEIPEYALRVSLIYDAQIDYDMTGTVSASAFPVTMPVYGSISMPQSIDLRAQSGVAPGWLAFGAVKWTNWDVAQNMPLCPVGTPVCTLPAAVSGLTLLWKDSWTVTLGAAHQFSPLFSLGAHVTWDEGATKGFTSQTDTWTTGLFGVLTPNKQTEIKLGGMVGVMTGGKLSTSTLPGGLPNPVGYTATFGNDFIYALRASATLHY